jgi:hypothetical protein
VNEITRLRAADPLRRSPAAPVDPGVWDGLTAEVMSAGAPDPVKPRRRRLRGWPGAALAAGVLALGGGLAVAGRHGPPESTAPLGGDLDLTCLGTWSSPDTWTDGNPDAAGGPTLTADPVADCAVYRAKAGLPPTRDPVAFRWNTYVYVAPRDQVPIGAVRIRPPGPADAAALELTQSIPDYVDGVTGRCLDAQQARRFAEDELKRLRLTGWKIVTLPSGSGASPEGRCSDADADPVERTVSIRPLSARDVAAEGFLDKNLGGLRTALVDGISRRCVGLDDARRVAEQALATLATHWPLTVLPDPAARCARVDLDIGGDVQVTVHAPAKARP